MAKETVGELIAFIYSGKVDVKHENLDDFLNAAKELDIKGINHGSCAQTSDLVQPSTSNLYTPAYNAEQYQSTRTIRVPSPAKINQDQDQSNGNHQPLNAFHQQKTDSDFKDTDEMNQCVSVNGYYVDVDDYYGSDTGNLHPLDHEYGAQSDPWNLTFGTDKKNSNGTPVQRFQHENGAELNEVDLVAPDCEINVPEEAWNFDESLKAAEIKPVKSNVFKRAKREYGESNILNGFHISST